MPHLKTATEIIPRTVELTKLKVTQTHGGPHRSGIVAAPQGHLQCQLKPFLHDQAVTEDSKKRNV